MEFRGLTIAQKDSSTKYIFNNKVNLVTSTTLSDELLKINYNLTSSEYFIEAEEPIALADLFQIKVRIAKTGVMMLNFKKDALSEEQKQNLINEIGGLKDDAEPTEESQKNKIARVIDIVNKYSPLYVGYTNTGDFLFTRLTFEVIVKDKEIDFPILLLLPSLGYEDVPEKPRKNKGVRQPAAPKVRKEKTVSSGSFIESLKLFKSLDYVFFGIFSIFIAFGFIISAFEVKNGEGIAAFLIILTIAFIVTLYYATYKAYKENEEFSYKLNRIYVPIIYIVLGITLGIVIGYLITTYVIKLKEEVEINYGLLYGLFIPVSLIVSLLSLPAPLLLSKIFAKTPKK